MQLSNSNSWFFRNLCWNKSWNYVLFSLQLSVCRRGLLEVSLFDSEVITERLLEIPSLHCHSESLVSITSPHFYRNRVWTYRPSTNKKRSVFCMKKNIYSKGHSDYSNAIRLSCEEIWVFLTARTNQKLSRRLNI